MLRRSLGSRRVLTNEERLGSARSVRAALESTGRQGRGLRPDRRPSCIARQGCGGAARRGGRRDRRRGRRDRGRQDRGPRRPPIAAGYRPLVGSIRPSVVVVAGRRDRSRTVRSGARGPLRVVGRDADLSRSRRAHGPVRRAARPRESGSGLLLAHARGRLPDPDDAARPCAHRWSRGGGGRRHRRRGGANGTRRIARRSRRCSRTIRCCRCCGSSPPRSCWECSASSISSSAGGSRRRFDVARHGAGTSPISRAPLASGGTRRRRGGFAIARCGVSWNLPVSDRPDGSRPPNGSSRSSARSTRPTKVSPSSDGCATGPHRWWAPTR